MTSTDSFATLDSLGSARLEALLQLLGELIAAESAPDTLATFRDFVSTHFGDPYVSLWYLDTESTPASLLLADEFGQRHGGSVAPEHNRLAVGVGIVGTAASTATTQRKDMSNTLDLTAAASPKTIELEGLRCISAIAWPRTHSQPGGAVLLGDREGRWLSPDEEGLLERAAREVMRHLVRLVENRSRSILPRLISDISDLTSEEDIIARALEVLAEEFVVDFGYAASLTTHDYLTTVKWKHGASKRDVAKRPVGIDLMRLPQSVRLFHALDDAERTANSVPPETVAWLRELLQGEVGRFDHVIAASLRTQHGEITHSAGLVLLSRHADALAFLPEEGRVLAQVVGHLGLLISLNRREALRQRVVRATQDVALGSDLQLAILSFFLSSEDIVDYEIASVVLENSAWNWEAYSHAPRDHGKRTAPSTSGLSPEPLSVTDPSVGAIDRIALSLIDIPSHEIADALRRLASELVPPPEHRAVTRSDAESFQLPLLFGGKVRGALFLSLPRGSRLQPDQEKYVALLAQQLAVTWNVDRLLGTEERFLQLVDRLDRLFSASMLSLALSHETKGKLHTFSQHFGNVGVIARRLRSAIPDSGLVDLAKELETISGSGTENVGLLDDLARAISDALLSDENEDRHGTDARLPDSRAEPIYLNDIIGLYQRGLREAARGLQGGDLSKSIDITRLSSALDRPKAGVAHPFSYDPFDRIRLGQVFSNLVLNALDASGPRGKIEVETHYQKSVARLVVRDFGVGMTEEVKARLFEPFFSRKRGGKGFGLGMFIVRLLVLELGGDIAFVSKLHAGTTFTVSFPIPVRSRAEWTP